MHVGVGEGGRTEGLTPVARGRSGARRRTTIRKVHRVGWGALRWAPSLSPHPVQIHLPARMPMPANYTTLACLPPHLLLRPLPPLPIQMTPLWARCTPRGGGMEHQSACPLGPRPTSRNVSSSPRPGSHTRSCPSRCVGTGVGKRVKGEFSVACCPSPAPARLLRPARAGAWWLGGGRMCEFPGQISGQDSEGKIQRARFRGQDSEGRIQRAGFRSAFREGFWVGDISI